MLFALLKKSQNYAIFMLKVIILCRIMLTCTYAADDGSVQNTRGIVLLRALYCGSKSSTGSPHRPDASDLATTVTDCSGLDMLSRES